MHISRLSSPEVMHYNYNRHVEKVIIMPPAHLISVLLDYKPSVLRASQEVNRGASKGKFLWVGYFFNLSERSAHCIYTVFSFLHLFWLL